MQKESVKEFVVTGISFGTCHAMATAWKFANKDEGHDNKTPTCLGLGLHVPYLGSESCEKLGLKNHMDVAYTSTSANTSLIGTISARLFTSFASKPGDALKTLGPFMKAFVSFVNPGAMAKLELLMTEYTEIMNICRIEMDRCVVHTDQGILLYNYTTDTLMDHGFDITEIKPCPLV